MKLIIAGLILLALYAATGTERKAIKQDTQEVLDRFWEMETGDREWMEYWREVSK